MKRLPPVTRDSVQLSQERTGRTVARRNGALALTTTIALWSIVMMYGPGVGIGLGGATAPSVGNDTAATAATIAAPNTPTVDATVLSDTSAFFTTSAFAGSGGDTHDTTIVQSAVLSSDWTTLLSADTITTGDLTRSDTVFTFLADSTLKVRALHSGASGGRSAWSDSAQFVMTTGSALDSVYFFSDFGTATGTAVATLLDSSNTFPWERQLGTGAFEVFSTSGESRDYPTANFMRVGAGTGGGCCEINFENTAGYVPTVANGDSLFVRFYVRHLVTPGQDRHGIYFDDNTGGTNWGPQALGFYQDDPNDGAGALHVSAGTGNTRRYFQPCDDPCGSGDQTTLGYNVTWRYEVGYVRTGTSTYELRARLYNVSNVLQYDSEGGGALGDFCEAKWFNCSTGALTGLTFTNTGAGAAGFRGFKIGAEDGGTAGAYEITGIAICSQWCGAYPIAGVEN